ncbi:MAG: hypothetical protein AB1714_04005 [Acidobacteriota bacterium]
MTGEASEPRKRARALTADSLRLLMSQLHPDPDRAGEQYLLIRRKLIRFLEWKGCPSAADLADEVFFRVAARLNDGLVIMADQPATYFLGVARNVLHEYWDATAKTGGAGCLVEPAVNPVEQEAEEAERLSKEQRIESLNECMGRLAQQERDLVIAYYGDRGRAKIEARNELARRLGVSINALRLRILRIKEEIRACIEALMK